MKLKSSALTRRKFLTVTTVGIALGSNLRPTASVAAGAQTAASGGTGIKPTGTSRLLYVCNEEQKQIDVHDTDDGHRLVRSIPWVGTWAKTKDGEVGINEANGICGHPAIPNVIMTNRGLHIITAYNAVTGKVAWQVDVLKQGKELGYAPYDEPDRLIITADGSALFVPMRAVAGQKDAYSDWDKHVNLVVDPANGKVIAPPIPRPGRPHNNWMGEAGLYAYLAGRSDQTLVLGDQKTHKLAKTIGPFGSPVRQAVTGSSERYVYLTLTRTIGMGVGDVRAGKVLPDVTVQVPKERTKNWRASSSGGGGGHMPHGDNPWSHGIGMRPGGSEDVYLMDDEWGYLYVFDTKTDPARPKLKGHVPLFTNIEEPWQADDPSRWVTFSIDGKWCYPSDGSVVDCETGKLSSMKIARSEKICQLEFRDGKCVAACGQQGGVYGRKTS